MQISWVCLAVQLAGIVLAQIKQSVAPKGGMTAGPKITLLRPVCGLENNLDPVQTIPLANLQNPSNFDVSQVTLYQN